MVAGEKVNVGGEDAGASGGEWESLASEVPFNEKGAGSEGKAGEPEDEIEFSMAEYYANPRAIEPSYELSEEVNKELDAQGTWKVVGRGERSAQIAMRKNDGSLALMTESDYLGLTHEPDSPYAAKNNPVLAKNPSLASAIRALTTSVAAADCKLGMFNDTEASYYTSALRAINDYAKRAGADEVAVISNLKTDLAKKGAAFSHLSRYAERFEKNPESNTFAEIRAPEEVAGTNGAIAESDDVAETDERAAERAELMRRAAELNARTEQVLAELQATLVENDELLRRGREAGLSVDVQSEAAAAETEEKNRAARAEDEAAATDAEILRRRQEIEEINGRISEARQKVEMAIDAGDFDTAQSYLLAYLNETGDLETRAKLYASAVTERSRQANWLKEVAGEQRFNEFVKEQQRLEKEAEALLAAAFRKRDEVMTDVDELAVQITQGRLSASMRDSARRMFN